MPSPTSRYIMVKYIKMVLTNPSKDHQVVAETCGSVTVKEMNPNGTKFREQVILVPQKWGIVFGV